MNAPGRRVAQARLSINTVTLGNPPLLDALDAIAATGARKVGLWRETYDGMTARQAARAVADHGLQVSSLCRCVLSHDTHTMADSRRAVDDAHQLGAAVLVVLAGGLPPGSHDLAGARARVAEAFAELANVAGEAGVRLALEPLHPMFAASRSVVNTLRQALDIVEPFPGERAGVVLDTFNVWWDPELADQICRAGLGNKIAAVQIADWSRNHEHGPFLTRALPGDGIIDNLGIIAAADSAGYRGPIEVEIFNDDLWQQPPRRIAEKAMSSFFAALC
ncbi:sugar phosphate isomerase/epimerase family protein [Microbacterium rhizomatis]|uniref:sugar phosphate isomerase/epimerase family protein n=1 Tax=Microbacterium rhizomatis TaxID=1631477 RepID=UPI001B868DAA|nr:sugar phosphate isomerase/epimerase family protein [Microbacterium rhizomatis]